MMKLFSIALVLFLQVATAEEPKPIHFEKIKISIGTESLEVEVAETREQMERGLMYRKELLDGKGMIFIYPDEEYRSFWMKNTFVPLSIGFFDKNKKLIDIQDMEPVSVMVKRPPSYGSAKPAMYAVEVPKGWFKRRGIKLGAVMSGLESKAKKK